MSKGSIQRQRTNKRTNRRYQSNIKTILPGDFNISLVPLESPSSLKASKQLQNRTIPQLEQIKQISVECSIQQKVNLGYSQQIVEP